VAQGIEPTKHEALSSNPVLPRKKNIPTELIICHVKTQFSYTNVGLRGFFFVVVHFGDLLPSFSMKQNENYYQP
jgi:hypothetical protein